MNKEQKKKLEDKMIEDGKKYRSLSAGEGEGG
jgi:hypothetical protein